ncbi:hypothetical protein MARHY1118 [Marinobacter nauticus ATCC 49840]|nr:hypothetical protein MARHY1118 [Marinobacter nauticus ATCC 49840]
MKYLKFDEI